MIMENVLKAFKTVNRKFKPGDVVSEADLEGSALDWSHLKSNGFVGTPAKPVDNRLVVSKSKESAPI